MNRNLLGVLMGALLAVPAAATAAVELYGVAHASLDVAGNDDTAPANEDSVFSVSSNKSRIGLRGSEALSERLAVLWQFENTADLDNGGWGPARDSYIGLQTGLGTFRAGKHVTPYRMGTDSLDIFADSRADYNAVIGTVDGEVLFSNRAQNILLYTSPQDKRVRGGIAYIANVTGDDDLPQTTTVSDQTGVSLAMIFDSGPFYLSLGYERLKELKGPAEEDAEAAKLGGRWLFGQGTSLGFVWEDASTGELVSGIEKSRQAFYLNLAHVSGNNTWKAAYGLIDELDTAPDSGADYVALGWYRALSRRTDFYLLYAGTFNDTNGTYGLQPDHDGGTNGGVIAVAGEDATALSAGLIHRFDVTL